MKTNTTHRRKAAGKNNHCRLSFCRSNLPVANHCNLPVAVPRQHDDGMANRFGWPLLHKSLVVGALTRKLSHKKHKRHNTGLAETFCWIDRPDSRGVKTLRKKGFLEPPVRFVAIFRIRTTIRYFLVFYARFFYFFHHEGHEAHEESQRTNLRDDRFFLRVLRALRG